MKDMLWTHVKSILRLNEDDLKNNMQISFNEINNLELREKMLIVRNYYHFINNPSCVDFLEKSFEKIDAQHMPGLNKKDKLVLCVIILQSFIDKKNFPHMGENYIASEEIYNYIYDQFTKYLIFSNRIADENKLNRIVIQVVDMLTEYKIISKKIIPVYGAKYKTYKYFRVKIDNYTAPCNFNFSFIEFQWLDVNDKCYIHTLHYSRMFEINKSNFNSKKSFKIKDKDYFLKKINLKLYVDDEYQLYLKKFLTSEENLNLRLQEQYDFVNSLYNNNTWTSETKEILAEGQRKLAKLIEEHYISNFLKENFENMGIYFPLFVDFRGRKYYFSIIGPTGSKLIRLAYFYGYYEQKDFKIEKNVHSLLFEETLNLFCERYEINSDPRFRETIFWCLIGIGKFFINKNEYPINTKTFLEMGIRFYNNEFKCTQLHDSDLSKELEIAHYKRILKSLWKNKIKKRALIKDATASINQILMKRLGPLDQNSLNYVNLGEKDEWHDTYIIYRDKFFELYQNEIKMEKNDFFIYFNRKLIKSTIMTIPYSAGFELCWKNYLTLVANESIDLPPNFKKIFKKFYIFVKDEMQTKFLYKSSSKILLAQMKYQFEKERQYILKSETGDADISYYKMRKYSIDKKYTIDGEKKRISRLVFVPTTAIDFNNFNIASGANSAHFLDAEEIRIIEKELGYSVITIHDSYLIDFNNCSELIDIKLKHYQSVISRFENDYRIKNIFVLL